MDSQPHIVIVGGSLAGLTLALACASRGVPVHVVERAAERLNGGDSLSVSLAAIAATTGHDPRVYPKLAVVPAYRDRHLTTWPALYAWLRGRALETPGILLDEGKTVTSVNNREQGAELHFSDGTKLLADAVIGADGYYSVVRRAISPEAPYARYAGYLVWRGLVEEQTLTRPVAWPSDGGLWIDFERGYRLVAAVLPGRDGSLEIGRRLVTFAWFDAHREALLRATNRLTPDGNLVGTLGRGSIGSDVRAELLAMVPKVWPERWAEAVAVGVQSTASLSGAPIAEYVPDTLAVGAVALVGDAGHVVSPMTGSGFAAGVDDAMVLARILADRPAGEPASNALLRYQAARLPYVRALVQHSRRLSAEYVQIALK
ncbi:FAD-dependent monooxygenase [Variovorax saccharolyticus]|uniref:FAD-dependent monooxygenase n=1 Tax=Variovorax saccharolyticus TaxID=3053516 RepID=UPI0025778289|nr:FAD-dependent monooxygenase [Variovorax sp. J22R187]MDM0018027.1 FAD-dependent monooxygenase [Variovorax sp. J22R187]